MSQLKSSGTETISVPDNVLIRIVFAQQSIDVISPWITAEPVQGVFATIVPIKLGPESLPIALIHSPTFSSTSVIRMRFSSPVATRYPSSRISVTIPLMLSPSASQLINFMCSTFLKETPQNWTQSEIDKPEQSVVIGTMKFFKPSSVASSISLVSQSSEVMIPYSMLAMQSGSEHSPAVKVCGFRIPSSACPQTVTHIPIDSVPQSISDVREVFIVTSSERIFIKPFAQSIDVMMPSKVSP